MLSQWGIDFESVNVHGDAAAQEELRRLGIPLVPATVLGDRAVHGWRPAALAELMGVEYDDTPLLSPAELAESLDGILYFAQHLLKSVPEERMGLSYPGRDRILRDLAYHVFRLSTAFVDAMEQGRLPESWLLEDAPPQIRTGPELADYGAGVRKRIALWFATAPAEAFGREVETYYGGQAAHKLLERTAWHAGQHLRQVYDLLERDGYTPALRLPPELFEGLPMLDGVW